MGDVGALPPELSQGLSHAVDAEVLLEHAPHLDPAFLVALGPRQQPGAIALLGGMVVVGLRGDRKQLAGLGSMRLPVIVDERDHDLTGRSTPPRQNAPTLCAGSGWPAGAPGYAAPRPSASRHPCRKAGARRSSPQPFFTRPLSDCTVQPIFTAIQDTTRPERLMLAVVIQNHPQRWNRHLGRKTC